MNNTYELPSCSKGHIVQPPSAVKEHRFLEK